MSEQTHSDFIRLASAARIAVIAMEETAHDAIEIATHLLEFVINNDINESPEKREWFREIWCNLCESLEYCSANFWGRIYNDPVLPEDLRPYALLATVATTAEANGITGISLCHIAFRYALFVWMRVPKSDQVRNDAGNYGHEIEDAALPKIRLALRSFPPWERKSIDRIKEEIRQETLRAAARIPAIVADLQRLILGPDYGRASREGAIKLPISAEPIPHGTTNLADTSDSEHDLTWRHEEDSSINSVPDPTTAPPYDLPLNSRALAVLKVLDELHPRLMTNVEIEVAAHLSKQTVGMAIRALIARGLAVRPEGERKGATRTQAGREVLSRIP